MNTSPIFSRAGSELWDCTVIGGGVAGAAISIYLRRAGLRVLLVDKNDFPRSKVCGGCLSARAVGELIQLRVLPSVLQCKPVPVTAIDLRYGRRRSVLELSGGMVISRERLDAVLVDEAVKAGTVFVPNCAARLLPSESNVRMLRCRRKRECVTVRSRAVVVAAGLSGAPLFEEATPHAALKPQAYAGSRIGFGATLPDSAIDLEPGTILMLLEGSGYLGASKIENGLIDVAAAVDARVLHEQGGARAVAERFLQNAGVRFDLSGSARAWRGTASLSRSSSALSADGVFLVGDSARYIEPFTGEGMAWALLGARLLAPLVASFARNDAYPAHEMWNEQWRRHIGRQQRACRCFRHLLRRPALAMTAAQMLGWLPGAGTRVARGLGHYGFGPSELYRASAG